MMKPALPMKKMTKSQVRAYMRRWKAVNRFHRAEVRDTPPRERLRNVQFMLEAGLSWPWTKSQLANREREATQVRARWRKLREALGG